MNVYRELFNKYEGMKIESDNKNGYIFNLFRYIVMDIASGAFESVMNHIDKLYYSGLLNAQKFYPNINDSSDFSIIAGYIFKPIFYGETLEKMFTDDNGTKHYLYEGQCHNITLSYLKKLGFNDENVCAVTSLIRCDNEHCFHSYIYCKDSDLVWDFSNNIVMPKYQYDELLLEQELSVVSYKQYVDKKKEFVDDMDNISDLLYFGLIELKNNEDRKKLVNS